MLQSSTVEDEEEKLPVWTRGESRRIPIVCGLNCVKVKIKKKKNKTLIPLNHLEDSYTGGKTAAATMSRRYLAEYSRLD